MSKKSNVIVYSRPGCGPCMMTYRELDKKGVEYIVVDVTADSAGLERIKALDYLQPPVVVVEEERHWSGFRPDKLAGIIA